MCDLSVCLSGCLGCLGSYSDACVHRLALSRVCHDLFFWGVFGVILVLSWKYPTASGWLVLDHGLGPGRRPGLFVWTRRFCSGFLAYRGFA